MFSINPRNIRLQLLLGGVLILLGYIFQYNIRQNNIDEGVIETFQEKYLKYEQNIEAEVSRTYELISTKTNKVNLFRQINLNYPRKLKENGQFIYVYYRDSLIYWSDNTVPVSDHLNRELVHSENQLIKLQNGYYIQKIKENRYYTIVGLFLVKSEFPYENNDLVNEFNPMFKFAHEANLVTEDIGNSIYNLEDEFVFSIQTKDKKERNRYLEFLLVFLYMAGILVVLQAIINVLYSKVKKNHYILDIILAITIGSLRVVSLKYEWFSFLYDFEMFQPKLYASSEWSPNFGELTINITTIFFLCVFAIKRFNRSFNALENKILLNVFLLAFYLFGLFGVHYTLETLKGLIENSKIPFDIQNLFSLSFYSFLSIIGMGALMYLYYIYIKFVVRKIHRSTIKPNRFAVFWFFSSLAFLAMEIYMGDDLLIVALFPLVVNGLIIFFEFKYPNENKFGVAIIFLITFSLYGSYNLNEFYFEKEKSNRVIFAEKLAIDEDPLTEIEYDQISKKVVNNSYILDALYEGELTSKSEFDRQMELEYFNKFWDKYEINYYLFKKDGNPLINYRGSNKNSFSKLNKIISNHCITSSINSNIHYVTDYTDKLAYVIRQPIKNKDSLVGYLFCDLKSKIIPEAIGFPTLLMDKKAKIFEELESYSLAKYVNNKLVNKRGEFNYSLDPAGWRDASGGMNSFVNIEGYNHYIYILNDTDYFVLSRENTDLVKFATTFSYLFTIFGLLLLIPVIINEWPGGFNIKNMSLTLRIQFILIGLVLVSLLVFGIGAGIFIRQQYHINTKEFIREKMSSVKTEVGQKLGDENNLTDPALKNYMEYILSKFSKVFVTDINLYDLNGKLLGSSRPKIFQSGLLSSRMNPDSFHEMNLKNRSEFIHNERIGHLNYLSGYVPFVNKKGKILAYLNLQYFAQQSELETQISKFMIAIINVFIILFAFSIIAAILISNWLTKPLKLVSNSLKTIRFGKVNEPIDYKGQNEIGTLVQEYNLRVKELEGYAIQLAKSERESAWREMAKQVAHEIKNPLTPMKLGIQHMNRLLEENDPRVNEKINKLNKSLIEQIDALTRIANEFSNFAKMPKAKDAKIDIVDVLKSAINVFEEYEDVEIVFDQHEVNSADYIADKELLIRIFNNLLKNAIQAKKREEKSLIKIDLEENRERFIITIEDNGIGIPENQKARIFVPNFTTKSKGTGLGLAMVKNIVENYNGKITFTSEVGKGTIFYVYLPKNKTEN
jgi:signal transduction histidine kinase